VKTADEIAAIEREQQRLIAVYLAAYRYRGINKDRFVVTITETVERQAA